MTLPGEEEYVADHEGDGNDKSRERRSTRARASIRIGKDQGRDDANTGIAGDDDGAVRMPECPGKGEEQGEEGDDSLLREDRYDEDNRSIIDGLQDLVLF